MIKTMHVNKETMAASSKNGFTNATDAADYLVKHGVPFRDAHGIIGQLVLICIDKGIALDDLPLEEYKKISPVFAEDVYEAISMKTCVSLRQTIGAPGHEAMQKVIDINSRYLEETKYQPVYSLTLRILYGMKVFGYPCISQHHSLNIRHLILCLLKYHFLSNLSQSILKDQPLLSLCQ